MNFDTSITAPVGQKERITKPDPKKPNQKFKPVSNKPDDVELVQIMLYANGQNIDVDGKCGPSTVKAIKAFQKSALGYAKPDGIVDPDDKTWKKGLPKYISYMKSVLSETEERVTVKEGGKEKVVKKDELEKKEQETARAIYKKADTMNARLDASIKFCEECEKQIQGVNGFMMSLVAIGIRWKNPKTAPPYSELNAAGVHCVTLRSLAKHKKPDWKRIYETDKKATASYNKAVKAFNSFIAERIGSSESAAFRLKIVSELSFAVIEGYLTAQGMAKGLSPAKAHALAAGSVEALKSSSNQVGEYLAGEKVEWKSSLQKIMTDTAVATAAGMLGGKVSGALGKHAEKVLASEISKATGGTLKGKIAEIVSTKLLTNPVVQGALINAAKESINVWKPVVEKGKAPGQKEVLDSTLKIFAGGMSALVPVQAFARFYQTSSEVSKQIIMAKLAPAVGATLGKEMAKKGVDMSSKAVQTVLQKAYQKISDEVSGKASELAVQGAAESMTGKESSGGLSKLAENALRKDAALRREIEMRLMEYLIKEVEKESL